MAEMLTSGTGLHQRSQVDWLWWAAFSLKAPAVGRCASLGCKCIVSPTAVRSLPGEGEGGKGFT